jgi:glycosyl transferase, family 25
MRLLLINLDRSPDRLAAMTARLGAVGQPFEVLPATDGRLLGPEAMARADLARRRWFSAYPLTPNEIGCWLSHLRAMQSLLDSGEAMLAVLEDDLILDPALPSLLAAIEASGFGFDILYLHRHSRRQFFAPCAALMPGWRVGRLGYTQIGTQGYVVSRQGAERILAGSERFVHTIDNHLQRFWANRLDLLVVDPPAVTPEPRVASTIGNQREARIAMPGADTAVWEAWRRVVRIAESALKRVLFPLYVRRGRRELARAAARRS